MTHARKQAIGRFGERVAARYLQSLGMAILETNWTCKYGEVDIVARDGATLVICEVKTRTGTSHGTGLEAVSGRKATRLHWSRLRSNSWCRSTANCVAV